VSRFITEYSSLMDFGPYVVVDLFLNEDFWKMLYFGLYWNVRLVLELCYLEGLWFLLEDFFENYIFA
jgi:hypothetical protein